MKLTDKRFWKFEAMMLLCGVILLCQILVVLLCYGAEFESCNGAVLILLVPALCLYFVISGIPAWVLYKGKSWMKLAGYLYLFSALLLIIIIRKTKRSKLEKFTRANCLTISDLYFFCISIRYVLFVM